MNARLTLSLLFLVAIAGVLAENVTVTQSGNVTIVCNNMSQCAGTAPGVLPFFFTAIETNTTIPFVMTSTYEQNVTIIQNVTLNTTQINQTIEVTTQNITVVSCNESANAGEISTIVTNNLVAQLQTNLATTCGNSCRVSEDERNGLLNQKAEAERQHSECAFQLEAQLNSSRKDYEYLNATLSQEIEDLESQQGLTLGLALILATFTVGAAFIFFQKAVLHRYIKGRAKQQTPGRVRE